jgi:ADP-ribose pyrophosphatase YjhB (NUDIX family)
VAKKRYTVIITNTEQYMYLWKRGFVLQLKGKNSENAGKWSSAVSGHVEFGESYEDAAIREAKEELGLEIDKKELIRIIKIAACKETNNEFVVLFTYLMDRNTESIKLDPDEIENILIAPLADVIKDVNRNLGDYSPAFIKLLDEWLDYELLEKVRGGENG